MIHIPDWWERLIFIEEPPSVFERGVLSPDTPPDAAQLYEAWLAGWQRTCEEDRRRGGLPTKY